MTCTGGEVAVGDALCGLLKYRYVLRVSPEIGRKG